MRKVTLLVVFAVLLLASCGYNQGPQNIAPAPDSDSSQNFSSQPGFGIPVDDAVYTITGKVIGDVESLTRQTEAAQGSYGRYGNYATGVYFGAEFGGKGFVRLFVHTSDSELAPPESIVIIKTSDTKASALLPGDVVTFKCRAQYEAVAAVRDRETFDMAASEKLATWELDYCRLFTPEIKVMDTVTQTVD